MTNLNETASQVRREIVWMVHAVQSGHPGGSSGCADYLTAQNFDIMKHNHAFDMHGEGEAFIS